jgi:transcriptional regulator with XRE-family HTH domain
MLEEYRETPESYGHLMSLNLADIILYHLRAKGWTQKRLADAVGMAAPQLTKIIHAQGNCTFATAGRIMHALGIDRERIKSQATPPSDSQRAQPEIASTEDTHTIASIIKEAHNGRQKFKNVVQFNATIEVKGTLKYGGGDNPKARTKKNVA